MIILTNDDPVHQGIYKTLGGGGLINVRATQAKVIAEN